MKVNELPFQNKGDFYSAYLGRASEAQGQFDYEPFNQDSYLKRWKELQERSFQRQALYEHLIDYHQGLPASVHTLNNIERLKQVETTVVVTGQQAGLLTGPLYTIHKCISAIHFAKRQEAALNTPVVPVFWIAGEDHDFDEINHIYTHEENRLVKKKLTLNEGHRSVSHIPLPKEQLSTWVEEVIRGLGETESTLDLKDLMYRAIKETETITDFFAYLMVVLFSEEGIVLLNSNDPGLRRLESDYFSAMIENNKALDESFQGELRYIKGKGYPVPVESEPDNSHLFLEVDQNRVLLLRDDDTFRGKKNECLLTKDELIEIAKQNPERLSNNVISRPLMQDFLLPTLAFIAGPGEIAYWSVLKSVFHQFGIKMAPVMPRLSLTILESETSKLLDEMDLDLVDVLKNGVRDYKQQWLENKTVWNIDSEFIEAKQKIDEIHRSLRLMTGEIDKGLIQFAQKNGKIINDQLDFLKTSLEHSIVKKHELELNKFDRVGLSLMPDGKPQERVFNILYYLNRYGLNFVSELSAMEFEFNGDPKVVRL